MEYDNSIGFHDPHNAIAQTRGENEEVPLFGAETDTGQHLQVGTEGNPLLKQEIKRKN